MSVLSPGIARWHHWSRASELRWPETDSRTAAHEASLCSLSTSSSRQNELPLARKRAAAVPDLSSTKAPIAVWLPASSQRYRPGAMNFAGSRAPMPGHIPVTLGRLTTTLAFASTLGSEAAAGAATIAVGASSTERVKITAGG